MNYILGISAFYHDSAAALLAGGECIAAAQEERFTRKKNDAAFPENAIRYCLQEGGITLEEVDAVVFYDKPLLKFERLLETHYRFAPKGLGGFIRSMPVWVNEKLFFKRLLYRSLRIIGTFKKKDLPLFFPEHHLSHAASAYFTSPFADSAILTIDGVGEWATASIGRGKGHHIELLKEMHFPHSVGLLYSAATYYLGFRVNSGEYKVMGLAPYGQQDGAEVLRIKSLIREKLCKVYDDGSVWLNQRYFSYANGSRMAHDSRWCALFGFKRRKPESPIEQRHCNLALAFQQVTEEIVMKMAATAKSLTRAENLCMAGGVALNCVANGRIWKSGLFENIYIHPAAGDAGGALGAALAVWHMGLGNAFTGKPNFSPYLGPAFEEKEIERAAGKYGLVGKKLADRELLQLTAARLAEGKIVGWFQGRMEWGPRALGNRSILADPRNPEMQRRLNLKIKNRESFRPFAPAVKAEHAAQYFDLEVPSPYMLLVADVAPTIRNPLPADYASLSMKEKLAVVRSELPAITHVDFSARIQTVNPAQNPRFYALLSAFEALTGCPVLVNTSFNVREEPIVCTPVEAIRCFLDTEMEVLVVGNYFFDKSGL